MRRVRTVTARKCRKLLMAAGIQRNDARELTESMIEVNDMFRPYGKITRKDVLDMIEINRFVEGGCKNAYAGW